MKTPKKSKRLDLDEPLGQRLAAYVLAQDELLASEDPDEPADEVLVPAEAWRDMVALALRSRAGP